MVTGQGKISRLKKYFRKDVKKKTLKELGALLFLLVVAIILMAILGFLREVGFIYYLAEKYEAFTGKYPALSTAFKFTTLVGAHRLFMFFLFPFLFWIGQEDLVKKLILILIIAGGSSYFIRSLISLPRPYYPELEVTNSAPSFPSGHVVQMVTVLGYLTIYYQKKILGALFLILVGFTSFQRLFIGAHYFDDVIAALIFSAFLIYFFDKFVSVLNKLKLEVDVVSFTTVTIGMPFAFLFLFDQFTAYFYFVFYLWGFMGGVLLKDKIFHLTYSSGRIEKFYRVILGLFVIFPYAMTRIIVLEFIGLNIFADLPLLGCLVYLLFGLFITIGWPVVVEKISNFTQRRVIKKG